ncbi:MAG: serine hydrolase, partial [Balneolaceae bacterium]
WLNMARTPTDVQKDYGFMNFFLNTDRERFSNAPESSFFHLGAGANVVYVDPENDLVVVVRWIDFGKMNEFLGLLYEAM